MKKKNTCRLVIIHTDQTYGSMLKAALPHAPRVQLVSHYSDVESALTRCGRVAPDLVLVDLELGGLSPATIVNMLRSSWPCAKIVALARSDSHSDSISALAAGADGCLLKQSPLAAICEGVEEALAGGNPMSPAIARAMVSWFRERQVNQTALGALTGQERKIAYCLGAGTRNKEIADTLQLAEATVRAHLRRIYEKLHIHSRSELSACLQGPPAQSAND